MVTDSVLVAPVTERCHRIHRDFSVPLRLCRFSQRRYLCWAILALALIAGRVALLPLLPVPDPHIADEYSYVFAADTFAHGRLANPAPPHPEFFESGHVLVHPTYVSKYPPGQGFFLALGERLTGHPYWGVVLSGALMIFLFCWAANAWLPPQWALIAGGLSWILFCSHYWLNSYWGGAVAASGGALVVGGIGYLLRQRLAPASFSLGIGAAILQATRPYEGGVLCVMALIVLAVHFWRLEPLKKRSVIRRVILPNLALLTLAALLAAYYNWRTTGNATEMPYLLYAQQYDSVRPMWAVPPLGLKSYSNANLVFMHQTDVMLSRQMRSLSLPKALAVQLADFLLTGVGQEFLGFGLLLLAVPLARMQNRKKWLVFLFAGVAGLVPITWIRAHYVAPFIAAELILIVAAGRAMWYRTAALRFRGPVFALALAVLAVPLGIQYAGAIQARPTERAQVIRQLEALSGRHLVFVDYLQGWDLLDEWVYNGADLDSDRIIFAHDFGNTKDHELVDQYKDRRPWRLKLGPGPSDIHLERYY